MAEQEPVAQAQLDDDDDHEQTPGYKPPAPKSLDEIVKLDEDDESLRKYKQTLLGGEGGCIVDECNPNRVIVRKLALITFKKDEKEEVEDRVMEFDLNDVSEKFTITLKEGCSYIVKIFFHVQREIVNGLRYRQVTTRKGVKVDKSDFMVGSYGPSSQLHCYTAPKEDAPSGILARGDYKVKSKFIDDDQNIFKQWEWTLSIKKEV